MREEEEEQIQSDREHAERLQKEEDTVMVSACGSACINGQPALVQLLHFS